MVCANWRRFDIHNGGHRSQSERVSSTAQPERGLRLSDHAGDRLVTWPKPAKPSWMDDETYNSLPEIVMQMDHLRCKAPHRVRNEFYMHLLAYNLIRQVMSEASLRAGVCPHQISFKGAMQTLNRFLMSCSVQI